LSCSFAVLSVAGAEVGAYIGEVSSAFLGPVAWIASPLIITGTLLADA
jgi:hypothetical protein